MVPTVEKRIRSEMNDPLEMNNPHGLSAPGSTLFRRGLSANWRPTLAISLTLAISAWGCGGGKPAAEKPAEEVSEKKPAPAAEKQPQAEPVAENTSDREPGATSPEEQKSSKGPSIDGIPLDVVWYDDPLAVAADATPVGGATGPAVAAAPAKPAATEPAPTAPSEAAPAGGGSDWKDLISGELIGTETKKIKNRLTDSLSSVGKYNGNYKDGIQVDGAVLAALAQVLHQHPDSLSWKPDAPTVRDLSSELAKKAKGLGQASYDPSKEVFVKLEGVLSGNKPPGLEEAPPQLPFGEFASRMALMKRMQKSFDFMKSNIQNDAAFKKEAETIQHEAAMLATLTKVTGAKEYPGGDEDEYQQFIKDLVKASVEAVEASKADEFPKFQDAITRVQKLCDACHQAYRFGDG